MKRCSLSYVIREMQIKTTLRYHYTPVKITKTWDPGNTKHQWRCGATGTLIHFQWESKMLPTLEDVLMISQKTKQILILQSSSCTPWYLSKGVHNFSSVQFSRSVVSDSATPRIAARQASLSITNSRSLLTFMPTESVMPSSHLILCRPLLLLPPIPPSIQRVNSSHEVAKVLEFQLQHHNL